MKLIQELLGNQEVQYVQKDQSVLEATRRMAERNIGAVSVLDGERLIGIFSERDLMVRVVSQELSPADTPVAQVMTANPVVVDAQATVEQCLRIMNQAKCRHLPVVTEGHLIGMISIRDLLLYDLDQKDSELEMMRAFIHYVPPSSPPGSGQ